MLEYGRINKSSLLGFYLYLILFSAEGKKIDSKSVLPDSFFTGIFLSSFFFAFFKLPILLHPARGREEVVVLPKPRHQDYLVKARTAVDLSSGSWSQRNSSHCQISCLRQTGRGEILWFLSSLYPLVSHQCSYMLNPRKTGRPSLAEGRPSA